MIEPLVVEFEVAAEPERAFAVWTERIDSWWPLGHTVSGDAAAIVFEPRVGGRIAERARDGAEHSWGEVIAWEPPARVRYWWHPFFAREEATEVAVTFAAVAGGTRVRIEQSGWDALGAAGAPRREKTQQVWLRIAEPYAAALAGETGR